MARPRIRITLIDQKGEKGCHRGHKIGDSYDFDTERGKLCPMAMHFPTWIYSGMAVRYRDRRRAPLFSHARMSIR